MDIALNFLPGGILYLLTLAFGLWLSHVGKPYNGILFNFHKLIALSGVIVTLIQVIQLFKYTNTQALVIALVIIAGLCMVALFATGAFMSIGKPDTTILKPIHHVALILLPISMGVAVYLLGTWNH
jgi:hypothetical protein